MYGLASGFIPQPRNCLQILCYSLAVLTVEHALQTLLMLYLSQTSHFVCMMPESCDSVSSDLLWTAAILFQWKFQWLCMASEENHSQVNFNY